MPISILELFCFYGGMNSRGLDGDREEIQVSLLDGTSEAKKPSRNLPEM